MPSAPSTTEIIDSIPPERTLEPEQETARKMIYLIYLVRIPVAPM